MRRRSGFTPCCATTFSNTRRTVELDFVTGMASSESKDANVNFCLISPQKRFGHDVNDELFEVSMLFTRLRRGRRDFAIALPLLGRDFHSPSNARLPRAISASMKTRNALLSVR